MDLRSIIDRLGEISGADLELDAAIHVALGLTGTAPRHYTGSIHAAHSIIPQGWTLAMFGPCAAGGAEALVSPIGFDDVFVEGRGATATIAVAVAALKARDYAPASQ